MKRIRSGALLALVAMLSGCGSSGGTLSGGGAPAPTPTPVPTPTPTPVAGCSLHDRQTWAFDQLNEWYLFPETLPTSLDPTPYASVEDYVDALTATARGQGRDRYFTYVTSIAEEDAYYNSGQSAGFGFRLGLDSVNNRLFAIESFENTPALAAGIDRGTEIIAIGTSSTNMKNVSAILAGGGTDALNDALGPNTAGTTRILRIQSPGGAIHDVTVAKADYELTPVSSRYGAKIINDNGRQVGYVNLRTFINTADQPLRDAFQQFRNAGITDVIVDLRYNGGGLVSIAQLMGSLLGGARSANDVFAYMSFRASKSAENETLLFAPQPQSVAPTRIAFIGTGGTASASELVMAAMVPYLHANAALIGTNTYGKPVGQIAIDNTPCDDRFRIIAFALENSAHQGSYFNGLKDTVEASCQADDDILHPLGDPAESSTRAALNYLEGQACTPIAGGITSQRALGGRELLTPERPTTIQREVPGAF